MCGLAGIHRLQGDPDATSDVLAMLACLTRRGPDDQGLERADRTTLGHRRLAIQDLTAAGHQPMRSPDGRYLVVFNGEIYNVDEVLAELGLTSADLRSRSDTEVLLRAWERWGIASLDRFAGQWAFAMHDTTTGTLWLARDRFGEKPLYVHADASRIAFASSLESLTRVPGVPRTLDPQAVAEYLAVRWVLAPRTILRDVEKVPPGTVWEYRADGRRHEHRWYDPRFVPDARLAQAPEAELSEAFDVAFRRACRRCRIGDVPSALLLSDGIDSHAIRHALEQDGPALPTLTFEPERRTPALAERLAALDHVFGALTEPIGDGASLATWTLIHEARPHATVFLCGHGGDEILGGYRLSQDGARLRLFHALAHLPGLPTAGALRRWRREGESLATLRHRLRTTPSRETPATLRFLVDRALPADLWRGLVADGPAATFDPLARIDALYAECAPDATALDRIQEVLLRTFLSANILSFADSVAMDQAAELRMPFLDRDLVAFALTVPAARRVGVIPGRTNTKLVLRRWAEGRLPDAVRHRHKRGFRSLNVSELLADGGATVRRRLLGSPALQRTVPGLSAWLDTLAPGDAGPFGGTLWAMLVLQSWCDRLGVA